MRCLDSLLGAALALLQATAAAARVDGSVSFDQGSVVQVLPSASIDAIGGAITLEGWVQIEGTTNHPAVIRRALATGPDAETVFGLGLPGGLTGVGFVPLDFWLRVGPDAMGNFTTFLTLTQVTLPPSLDGHPLAGTFDGTTMRLLWDGVEVASSVHPGGVASSTLSGVQGPAASSVRRRSPMDRAQRLLARALIPVLLLPGCLDCDEREIFLRVDPERDRWSLLLARILAEPGVGIQPGSTDESILRSFVGFVAR